METKEKIKRLEKKITWKYNPESRDIPSKYVVFGFAVIVFATAAGFFAGLQAKAGFLTETYSHGYTHFFIDGYRITFLPPDHPKMKGNDGLAPTDNRKVILLDKTLSTERVQDICDHELLHQLGIGSEHHEFIYRQQSAVKSQLCSKLKHRVREIRTHNTFLDNDVIAGG